MTAQQLRNSILQQAIQGRLVPQDPNDEPARVLLEKIRKQKEQLVKEGKLKKKDFRTYSLPDNLPFDLPDSWEWVSLSELVAIPIKRGKSPVYVSYSEYLAFAQKCNTKKGQIDLKLALYIDEAKATSYCTDLFLRKGDIVINSTGGGTMGRVGYYDVDNPFSVKGILPDSHVTTVRVLQILPKYAYYYIKTCQQYLESCGEGGTNQTELKPAIIASLPFPLPPLAEQRRIVAKIEELMPLVEKYGKAQSELDNLNASLPSRLRQSILQEAVQGKLVEQDEKDEWSNVFVSKIPKKKYKTNAEWPSEEPFDLPNGWNWCHIGDICDILNGYAFKSGNYVDSGIRVMRISNVQAGVIVDKDPKFYPLISGAEIKDYMLKEGDMLMSLTGNVGRVGILKADMLPAALNQRVACLRLHDEEIKPFFYHYLQSEIFRMRCESSGHGMAQLNISTEWLKQELIPLPPLAEQRRIVAKIEELFAEIDKLK